MVLNNSIHLKVLKIAKHKTLEILWLSGKQSACQCRRCGFHPWVRKIHWRRKWQPTWVFLPGKFHGQRSLVGYSPWDCKELDTTEHLSKSIHCSNIEFLSIHTMLGKIEGNRRRGQQRIRWLDSITNSTDMS